MYNHSHSNYEYKYKKYKNKYLELKRNIIKQNGGNNTKLPVARYPWANEWYQRKISSRN